MMKYCTLLLLFLSVSLQAQKRSAVAGLWVITEVRVGDETLTPDARWVRLHADGRQESGNGWLQHSTGSWTLEKDQLTIDNEQGIKDTNGPFTIVLGKEGMQWSRVEGGEKVNIQWKRATELPQTRGDKVMGVWKLDNLTKAGPYISSDPSNDIYIFFRWDNRFVLRDGVRVINGIYQVDAHEPQLILIPDAEDLVASFWTIALDEKNKSLRLKSPDNGAVRDFVRTRELPR